VALQGDQFVAFCADSRVRVWRFASGKLRRTYDESLEVRGRAACRKARRLQGRQPSAVLCGVPLTSRAPGAVVHRQRSMRHARRPHCVVPPPCRHLLAWLAWLPRLLQAAQELQRSANPAYALDDIDFGKRFAVERELAKAPPPGTPTQNAIFDDSGNFVLYPSLLGIKVRTAGLVQHGIMAWLSICWGCQQHACLIRARCCATSTGEPGVCTACRACPGMLPLLGTHAAGSPRWCLVQVVNLTSNKLATVLGRVENTERFLRIALYQGAPKKVGRPGWAHPLPACRCSSSGGQVLRGVGRGWGCRAPDACSCWSACPAAAGGGPTGLLWCLCRPSCA
jgi:hypothetical protein